MTRVLHRFLTGLVLVLGAAWTLSAADPQKPPALPDLSEYRTIDQAITTRISKASPAATAQPGYLGVHVAQGPAGKLIISEVDGDSPAAKAGLLKGDLLSQLAGRGVGTADALRDLLQSKSPGETVQLGIVRKDKPMELSATLAATSRPMRLSAQRAVLGVQVGEPKEGEGAAIEQIGANSAAAAAGLKTGDVILKVDDVTLNLATRLGEALAEKKPGDTVTLAIRRDGKPLEVKAKLGAESPRGDPRTMGWDNRNLSLWRKDVYRLAVICIEYPDVKHHAKVSLKDWEESLFSRKTYVKKNSATGQPVHGSLNDYYVEQSYGNLRVEGKVFSWIEAGKKRAEYSQGTGTSGKTVLLAEALEKLLARDGKDALKDFDGLFCLYAGDRVQTSRGGLYWPHRASFAHQGKRWAYFIVPEGGARMTNISVICHEFGHMLGLPDLYARPENPGSEGVGTWCAMSNQVGNGRPQHFSAWSKDQLGWLKPAVIDPTVKQKLILAPIEDSAKECIKVLVRPDGSEYLLLENRRKKGFDQDLPGEGLLIWRVVSNKLILEESHGVEGPAGPRVFPTAVPYPSPANNAFTPYTTPSSRSQLGGGLPVHITNIRRLPDGRITFLIGYEYL